MIKTSFSKEIEGLGKVIVLDETERNKIPAMFSITIVGAYTIEYIEDISKKSLDKVHDKILLKMSTGELKERKYDAKELTDFIIGSVQNIIIQKIKRDLITYNKFLDYEKFGRKIQEFMVSEILES